MHELMHQCMVSLALFRSLCPIRVHVLTVAGNIRSGLVQFSLEDMTVSWTVYSSNMGNPLHF